MKILKSRYFLIAIVCLLILYGLQLYYIDYLEDLAQEVGVNLG